MSAADLYEEDLDQDCPHTRTVADPDLADTTRVCTDCDSRLLLTRAQADALTIRDDGAFYVTDEDGDVRLAGPFLDEADADAAATRIGHESPGAPVEVHHLSP